MRVVCTVLAALCLAVVTGRAVGQQRRCCPSFFTVNENIMDGHFRCEVTDTSAGCDSLTMIEDLPDTPIDTTGNSYLMSDPKWHGFQENIACAFFLPPMKGHHWELWIMKYRAIDHIEGDDPCDCSCEDHVQIKEVGGRGQTPKVQTYCDFAPSAGDSFDGWCRDSRGPHNVRILRFASDVNTGVRTTFHHDNINGQGEGALVLATAIPQAKRRSARKVQTTVWPPSLRRTRFCHNEYSRCTNETCNIPCECYFDSLQRTSCTLYTIFTDTTGRTARMNTRSHCEVLRIASWHAVRNLARYGRLVPTYAQLRRGPE